MNEKTRSYLNTLNYDSNLYYIDEFIIKLARIAGITPSPYTPDSVCKTFSTPDILKMLLVRPEKLDALVELESD